MFPGGWKTEAAKARKQGRTLKQMCPDRRELEKSSYERGIISPGSTGRIS